MIGEPIPKVPVHICVDKKELVDDHWKYVAEVLSWTPMSPTEIKLVEFHYKSAFYHGMKHGEETPLKKDGGECI